jgi:hypothetical protein
MPALYSNRAAAHMAFGNLHKTIEDCSTVSINKCSLRTALIWAIDAACEAWGMRSCIVDSKKESKKYM